MSAILPTLGQFRSEMTKWFLAGLPLTSLEEHDARLHICREDCDQLQPNGRCKLCNCFMLMKTWLATSQCPKGKWLSTEESVWWFNSTQRIDALSLELINWEGRLHDESFIPTVFQNIGAPVWERSIRSGPLFRIWAPGSQPTPPMIGDVIVPAEERMPMILCAGGYFCWSAPGEGVTFSPARQSRIGKVEAIYRALK